MTVFFTDLDRTLIYSADALDLRAHDHDAQFVCVETYNGRPASFVTEAASRGIRRLLEADLLVPVTTRSVDQYRRVCLPGPSPRLALVANGGLLLRDGKVDEDYRRATTAQLDRSTPLDVVFVHLESVADPRFTVSIRAVEDLFCYAVVDMGAVPTGWTVELANYATELGWQVSDQGRKVYLLPDELSKGQAVQRVVDELNLDGYIAAGDANTDVSMLRAAASSIVPAHSELARRALLADMLVTSTNGVGAGEEIVHWAIGELIVAR
jgi:hypothetical protein